MDQFKSVTFNGKAVIYARVSTSDQVEGVSLDHQVNEGHKWGVFDGYEIVDTYVEKGVSGTKESRKELDRLLADAKEGKFDKVFIIKADRFSRDLYIAVSVLRELNSYGVHVYVRDLGADTSKPTGKLMFNIMSTFAEYDKDNIKERLEIGKMARLREGKYISKKPFGYEVTEDKQLKVIPEESNAVEQIFKLVAYGDRLSLRAIADKLNEDKMPSPTGNGWNHNSVNKIIKNELYMGKYIYNGEEINLEFEPIVNKTVWNRANNTLRKKGA